MGAWLDDFFHSSKCLAIHKTNKKIPFEAKYSIHGQTLQTVDSTKYLGVYLNKSLNWKPHVDAITKRADKVCSFLDRNLKKCSAETKYMAYRSLVRPLLEYSSPVWDPHTKAETDKIEKVQRRAAWFVFNDYNRTRSVSVMMNILHWSILQQRRKCAKVVKMYCIVYRLV